ncbi:MAG TPA: hypothetical protein VM557_01575 [Thermoanaerobaculia bacterium]|nr:hypothetical protein [Thermoanaerobaculia bacterium]
MTKVYRGDDESGAPDSKGAVEEDNQKTTLIKGDEVLGYDGAGREEHSGQNSPTSDSGLADNEPERVINNDEK